jgi:hypothetical protein
MFLEGIQQKRLPLTRDSYVLFLYATAIAIAGMSLLAGYIAEAAGSSNPKGWTFLPVGLTSASLSLILLVQRRPRGNVLNKIL